MTATHLTIKLRGESTGLETARLRRLQREIWDSLLEFISRYISEESDVREYLGEVTQQAFSEDWFTIEPGGLHFDFPDQQGTRTRSAAAARHWTQLAAAARSKTLEGIAEHADAVVEDDLPRLESLVRSPDTLFVPVEGTLWMLAGTNNGAFSLVGDGANRQPEALSSDARESVERVIDREFCECDMCARLRPDKRWEEHWRRQLESAPQVTAREAARFLLQSIAPTNNAIIALAHYASRTNLYRHARQMFEFGKRLDAEKLVFLRTAIGEADDPQVRAALVAVVAGLPLDGETRTEELSKAFDEESPVAETAVEFLGYGPVPTHRHDEVVEQLAGRVGSTSDLDHAIAVTLYNLYRGTDRPPRRVRQTLETLAGRPGEAADVATRALSWFD